MAEYRDLDVDEKISQVIGRVLAAPHKYKICGEFHEGEPYLGVCTRPAGHDGVHVAGTMTSACGIWGKPSANDFRLVENYERTTYGR